MKSVKLLAAIALCFLTLSAFAKIGFDPSDVKRFKKTNSCSHCYLTGISFYEEHQNANLVGANLSGSYLFTDFTKMDFSDGIAVNTFFGNTSGAKFINATLVQACFSGQNASGADFTNANVDGADFSSTNLFGAKITQAQLATAKTICDAILPDGLKGKCAR